MQNTSLEFFKSLIERDNKMLSLLLDDKAPAPVVTTTPSIKPYSNIKFVNDVLTIVLRDGNIITKHPATVEDFQKARASQCETDLFAICMSNEIYEDKVKKEKEIERNKVLLEGIEKLKAYKDFVVENGSVYLKGINRSMPEMLVEEFLLVISRHNPLEDLSDDDEFQSLKRFWMWACLNPRAEVADKLFNFLKKNSFKITKQGFFAALRNVVTIHGGTQFVQFVSESYNKVKAVWKKSPDKYHVFLNEGEYSIIHEDDMYETYEDSCECSVCDGFGQDHNGDDCYDCDGSGYVPCEDEMIREDLGEDLGILTDLYMDLPNREENRFTDAHTRTFDIRIGKVVNMDPAKCRWNTDDCGAEGLHFTSDEIHYVGCGDQSVLVLINPMKVVGIGESKGRCWEYLPIMTVPRKEATNLLHDLDFDTLELDEQYAITELEDLEEKVKDGFTAEKKKYSINFSSISMTEVKDIVKSLNKMKKEISDRVKGI